MIVGNSFVSGMRRKHALLLLLLECITRCDSFQIGGPARSNDVVVSVYPPATYHPGTVSRRSCSVLFSAGDEEAENGTDDDENFVDMSEVSDGEALLACRAYLQRKNRLGWQQATDRKELREQSRASSFFWETPEQQEYRSKREEEDIDFNQGDEDNLEEAPSDEEPTGLFTSMPTGPTKGSEIRRRIKKEQWKDPEFRERWYKARWGDHVKQTDASRKQQKMQAKLQDIPASILESQEFNMLTEEEIDEAIVSYVVSNRRRSRTRKKLVSQKAPQQQATRRQDNDKDEPLHRDSLFSMSEDKLRENQRKRSERAMKAYEARVSNAAEVKKSKPSLRKAATTIIDSNNKRKPTGITPKDALFRIGVDLDADRMPSLTDVESIMEAAKLSRRKDMLRRIVNEQFDLRGKCVSVPSTEEGNGESTTTQTKNIYLTQASIAQLGVCVIGLMKETIA